MNTHNEDCYEMNNSSAPIIVCSLILNICFIKSDTFIVSFMSR